MKNANLYEIVLSTWSLGSHGRVKLIITYVFPGDHASWTRRYCRKWNDKSESYTCRERLAVRKGKFHDMQTTLAVESICTPELLSLKSICFHFRQIHRWAR